MTIHTHYAVVSYCQDLTSPSAPATPIAVLLIGDDDQLSVAAVVAMKEFADVDPITRAFLTNIQEMLKNHVDSAFRENPNRPPKDLLVALHDALRNSLHVSKIEAGKDLELPDATLSEQWSSTVIEYASSLLAA